MKYSVTSTVRLKLDLWSFRRDLGLKIRVMPTAKVAAFLLTRGAKLDRKDPWQFMPVISAISEIA